MNKAILLATFLFLLSASALSQTRPPQMVTSGYFLKQTQPISPQTIFIPGHSGLYRISTYITVIQPATSGGRDLGVSLSWTDDAGLEQSTQGNPSGNNFYLTVGNPSATPPFAYGTNSSLANVFTFEAIGGTSVTLGITTYGPPLTEVVYSLYYVVEALASVP